MTDKMREDFERWKGYPLPPLNADGQYPKEWLQREWCAFKGGRESLVIRLPEAKEGRNKEIVKAVGRSLFAQGLKVEMS